MSRIATSFFVAGMLAAALCQPSFADDQTLRGRAKFTYYACIDPKPMRCYAFTDKQKADCKPCKQWEPRLFDHDFSADFDAGSYQYKNGKARGSKVLADFEAAVTGEPAEQAPTFRQIYHSPKSHNYLEVPASVDIQPGMAAVYPNFGGIFAAPADAPSVGALVYSSLKSSGDLKVLPLGMVAPEAPTKIVFNTRLFEIRDPVYWNVWAREETGGGGHTTILRPGSTYELRLDLAAFKYRAESLASTVSANARKKIDGWLAETASNLDLDLVLVTGDEFDDSNDRHQELRIDLDKMRRWFGPTTLPAPVRPSPPGDALAEIARGAQPAYLFSSGRPFLVHAAEAAKGMATITVTMWKDIPIDELTFSLCIASKEEEKDVCGLPSVLSRGFSGMPEIVTAPASTLPDVAVTFVAADPRYKVHGILRDNRIGADGKFVQWPLNKTMEELRTFVAQALEPAFSTETLLLNGFGFYQELFATQAAKDAFSGAIAPEMEQPVPDDPPSPAEPADAPPGPVTNPPRLLFRIIDASGPSILPVSFLVWQREDKTFEPIGFHYILDVPLGAGVPKQHAECISRWMLLYPPVPHDMGVDPVANAAFQARNTLAQWSSLAQKPFLANDIKSFGGWIASGTETTGAALVLLAHHASNRLWFVTDNPIAASLVGRSFAPPTVAILDGCGTGGSAASEFAKKFKVKGIEAMVVTNTDILFDLAGDYLNTLAEELHADQSRAGFDLAYAHFHTLRRLRGKKNKDTIESPYKEHALSFMLVGNGSLKLCAPE